MLNNLNKILHPVLCALIQCEHQFHLTGSRYFGNVRDDSDWDFFTADTPAVRAMLFELGFQEVSSSYADDPKIVKVFRLDDGNQFDIQLLKDVELKCRTQAYLKELFPYGLPRSNSKKDCSKLWLMAYELLELQDRVDQLTKERVESVS